MIKVAVFEDNEHLLDTFQWMLSNTNEFSCVGAHPNCDHLLEDIASNIPDVVLMDIEMPGITGIEATRLLKEHYPKVNIIIQTIFHDDQHIFNSICAGASGYILKSTSPDDYLAAIRDVHSGGSPMTPGIARRVLELFKVNATSAPAKQYNLTSKEKEVLQLLVEGKSYKMIADELKVKHETVKSHVSNIYAKLHVNSGTEAVAIALKEKIIQ